MKNENAKKSPVSSQTILLNCMAKHLAAFGYSVDYIDSYTGHSGFVHDDGTRMDFRSVRELMRFVREASHRKMY